MIFSVFEVTVTYVKVRPVPEIHPATLSIASSIENIQQVNNTCWLEL